MVVVCEKGARVSGSAKLFSAEIRVKRVPKGWKIGNVSSHGVIKVTNQENNGKLIFISLKCVGNAFERRTL
jgi:hypothetical protein